MLNVYTAKTVLEEGFVLQEAGQLYYNAVQVLRPWSRTGLRVLYGPLRMASVLLQSETSSARDL
jgi:hypothetical protein